MNISETLVKDYKEYAEDINKNTNLLKGDEETAAIHLHAVHSALTLMTTAINRETKRLAVALTDKN